MCRFSIYSSIFPHRKNKELIVQEALNPTVTIPVVIAGKIAEAMLLPALFTRFLLDYDLDTQTELKRARERYNPDKDQKRATRMTCSLRHWGRCNGKVVPLDKLVEDLDDNRKEFEKAFKKYVPPIPVGAPQKIMIWAYLDLFSEIQNCVEARISSQKLSFTRYVKTGNYKTQPTCVEKKEVEN